MSNWYFGNGDWGGLFVMLMVLAMIGLCGIVAGILWLIVWLFEHLQWVN